jgi:hypothetical protein
MAINNILNNSLVGQSGDGAFAGTDQPAFLQPTADNFVNGASLIVTAASLTVLDIDSTYAQILTGTTTQTVQLPVVTTLPQIGYGYFFNNSSTGVVTVQSSGADVVIALSAGESAFITCVALTGTDETSWNVVNILDPVAPVPYLTWNAVSGTTQACAVNNGYIANNAGQTTFTAPAVAAVGSRIAIKGVGAAGWVMTANTGQTIVYGNTPTTSAGTMTSQAGSDSFQMTCIVANTTWSVDFAVSAELDLV